MTASLARKFVQSTLAAVFIGPAGAFGAVRDYRFQTQHAQWTGTHAVLHGTQGENEVTLFCGMARDRITGKFTPRPTSNRMTRTQGDSFVTNEVTPNGISLITAQTGSAAAITALIDGKTLKGISGSAHIYPDGTVGIEGTPYPMTKTMFSKENFRQAAEDMQALCVAYGPKADWDPGMLPGEDQATLAQIDTMNQRLAPFLGKLPAAETRPQTEKPAPVVKPVMAAPPKPTPVTAQPKPKPLTAPQQTPSPRAVPATKQERSTTMERHILPTGQVLYVERDSEPQTTQQPTRQPYDRLPQSAPVGQEQQQPYRSSGRLRCSDLLPQDTQAKWDAYKKEKDKPVRREQVKFYEFPSSFLNPNN